MSPSKLLNTEHQVPNKPIIILTGGGSGGHITPILAVAEELKKLRPDVKLIFVGQTGDKLKDIPTKHPSIDKVYTVRAGKFRRYHGEGLIQLLDFKTLIKNIRDFFNFTIGIFQSHKLLKKLKPSGVFVKGGYVGVPVGLAAAWLKIPYVTHDSDAVPGLANHLISHWATAHAVALPIDVYKYPPSKTFRVGVPISSNFKNVSKVMAKDYKKRLGLKTDAQVLFVTGGGMGAQRINESVVEISPKLLESNPKLVIIHATGRDHEHSIKTSYSHVIPKGVTSGRVIVKGFFVNDLYLNSGAADLIICRAGATNIAEFAAQHKACIMIPNPVLTGGHQLKNAQYLLKQNAVVIVDDNQLGPNSNALLDATQKLLKSPKQRMQLGDQLAKFANPRSSKELAELLLDTLL